jgi:hypothetical protein
MERLSGGAWPGRQTQKISKSTETKKEALSLRKNRLQGSARQTVFQRSGRSRF